MSRQSTWTRPPRRRSATGPIVLAIVVLWVLKSMLEALAGAWTGSARATPIGGHVEVEASGRRHAERELQQALLAMSDRRVRKYAFNWTLDGIPRATMSAPGTDKQHHVANAFLVGYQPFATDAIWKPWHLLARKKTYSTDASLYWMRPEVWQNSQQAWQKTRGDCEDHAIVLADWLIEAGFDARVALGRWKGVGHAWTVVLTDQGTYLLEATDKAPARYRHLPLASAMPNYYPEAMFNREHYWINTGSRSTRAYQGAQWQRQSRYWRGAQAPG